MADAAAETDRGHDTCKSGKRGGDLETGLALCRSTGKRNHGQRIPRRQLSVPVFGGNETRMVTVARSRGIRFLFVLQSLSQLTAKYGREIGDIVKTNCNVKIFIGSDDPETRREFSELCGQKKIKGRRMLFSKNLFEFVNDIRRNNKIVFIEANGKCFRCLTVREKQGRKEGIRIHHNVHDSILSGFFNEAGNIVFVLDTEFLSNTGESSLSRFQSEHRGIDDINSAVLVIDESNFTAFDKVQPFPQFDRDECFYYFDLENTKKLAHLLNTDELLKGLAVFFGGEMKDQEFFAFCKENDVQFSFSS